MSSPPGRRRRAASAIQSLGSHQMDAPNSERTRSNAASGRLVRSAFSSRSSRPRLNSSFNRRAVSSWAGVMSTPTTRRALRFFNHAPKYAVPQPSSTTSLPSTSGKTPISRSGVLKTPQVISSWAHASRARASVYSAFERVQLSRLTATYSGSAIAEPQPDLPLRGLRRVRAVHEVVRHREREIAADRSGRGVRGIRRAHRRPDDRDRRLALEHEHQRRCRGDELDQLAEERLLLVLGVVLLGEFAIDGQELCRA